MPVAVPRPTPVRAVLQSVVPAAALPPLVWLAREWWNVAHGGMRDWGIFAFVTGVATAIHVAGHLVVAVPLFVRYYRWPGAALWRLPVALPLGMALGMLGLAATLLAFGYPGDTFRRAGPWLCGAGYGAASALAAWWRRPRPA